MNENYYYSKNKTALTCTFPDKTKVNLIAATVSAPAAEVGSGLFNILKDKTTIVWVNSAGRLDKATVPCDWVKHENKNN